MILHFKNKKEQRNFWTIFAILIAGGLLQAKYTNDEDVYVFVCAVLWLIFYRPIFWIISLFK
nr:hypothetical protein [uncultured bacterium]